MTEVLISTSDHQLILAAQRLGQLAVRLDNPGHVLAHVEAAKIEHEARRDAVALAHIRQQPGVAHWIKARVHGVADDVDPFGR